MKSINFLVGVVQLELGDVLEVKASTLEVTYRHEYMEKTITLNLGDIFEIVAIYDKHRCYIRVLKSPNLTKHILYYFKAEAVAWCPSVKEGLFKEAKLEKTS